MFVLNLIVDVTLLIVSYYGTLFLLQAI